MSLYGPALNAPDGISTSGSTFAFSMFSDAAGTIPALTTDTTDGFAFTIGVNLDGTTTVTNFSSQTAVAAAATSATPEPGSSAFLAAGISLLWMLRQQRRKGTGHSWFVIDVTGWLAENKSLYLWNADHGGRSSVWQRSSLVIAKARPGGKD